MNVERFIELGLYDPQTPGADERLALLRYLHAQGISVEDMVAADREGRLPGLAADPVLRGGDELYTADEVAGRTGMELELARRIWRALGFPDPGDAPTFTDADVKALQSAAAAFALFGEEATLQFMRTMGSALSRMAESMLALFEAQIGTQLRAAHGSDIELARAGAAAAGLIPIITEAMDPLLRHHLMAARRRRWQTAVGPTTILVRAGIAFADLVGYTDWSRDRSETELTSAIARFEAVSADIAGDHGGRLVKTIGDEVMLVAPDAETICRVALSLLDEFADHDTVPRLRVGVSFGEVVPADGDYFGVPVNLAARLAKVADIGEVACDASIVRAAADTFSFLPRGARNLKGFDEPVETFTFAR